MSRAVIIRSGKVCTLDIRYSSCPNFYSADTGEARLFANLPLELAPASVSAVLYAYEDGTGMGARTFGTISFNKFEIRLRKNPNMTNGGGVGVEVMGTWIIN